MTILSGSLVFTSGESLVSRAIRVACLARESHVGVFLDHPDYGPVMYHSTTISHALDLVRNSRMSGVQLNQWVDWVDGYRGRIWVRPMRADKSIDHESIIRVVDQYHGRPYEQGFGLLKAWTPARFWQKESPNSVFCSELAVLSGVAWGLVDTKLSAEEFAPEHLAKPIIKRMPRHPWELACRRIK